MRVFIFLPMCMFFFFCEAQDIQMSLNMFRSGDVLVKKQISCKNLVQKGDDVLWDISDADVINKSYKVKYTDVSGHKDRMACTERATMYYYDLHNDTLLIGGFENNSTKIDYGLKEIFLRFPMKYGDFYSGLFHGTGTYCDKLSMRSFGKYTVEADACGTLVLPEGDTLRSVTRIHTERFVYGISYPADSIVAISSRPFGTDSIIRFMEQKPFLLKTDIYRWYAEGYRYPVLEKHVTCLHGHEGKPYTETFYIPLSGQEKSDDSETRKNAVRSVTDGQTFGGIKENIEYYKVFLQEASSVRLEYRMAHPAEISYGVFTSDGKSVCQGGHGMMPSGTHCVDIDMSGCRNGVYVVYIDAGGHRYTEKITLKR